MIPYFITQKSGLMKTALFFILASLIGMSSYAQRITVTIAGNGVPGYNGDGKSGNTTQINAPHDVCEDANGNIYFVDQGNNRIRMISAKDGKISTIVSSISAHYMCIDTAGNLYVSQIGAVSKIDAVTHVVTRIAGTGTPGFSGDGGSATLARIDSGYGLCVDHTGNLFIADNDNHRIRKVDLNTGLIFTIAGNGGGTVSGDGGSATAASLASVTLVCVNSSGVVYLYGGVGLLGAIRAVNTVTGIITSVAGGTVVSGDLFDCPASSAQLYDLSGLCIDPSGNIFCNEISCSCRKIDFTTDSVYPVAGNYFTEAFADNINSVLAYMNTPYGLYADATGNVFIADSYNNRIRKSILLTHTPKFAFGKGQYMYTCAGSPLNLNTQLAVTDLDTGQTETWSIVSMPATGSLLGFPSSGISQGAVSIDTPTGLIYMPATGFSGTDSFLVQVSDGSQSDTIKIFVSIIPLPDAGNITGSNFVNVGATVMLVDTTANSTGSWNTSNSAISVVSSTGIVTGVAPGVDFIIYTASNSCGTTLAYFNFTVDSLTTGINTNTASKDNDIVIAPNPATQNCAINVIATIDEPINITITNILGETLQQFNCTTNQSTNIITELPAGTYIVKASGAHVNMSTKMVKQ